MHSLLLLFFSIFYLLLAVSTQHLQPFTLQRRYHYDGQQQPQSSDPLDPFSDLELLDIVLVASVDGKFHALNRTSGHVLWSMSSFPDADDPEASNYANSSIPKTLAPLVRTVHPGVGVEDVDDEDDLETGLPPVPLPSHEVFIIEPQSGDIYVLKPSSQSSTPAPLQRFPFSVPELVDMSPFPLPDYEAGYTRIFVGKKETSLLLVELETGKVKATVGADLGWEGWEGEAKQSHAQEQQGFEPPVDLDELEAEYAYHFDDDDEDNKEPPTPKAKPTEVYIGRTDYHVSIHTRALPSSSSPPRILPPTQNLSFSTYGPPTQDLLLQAAYTRPKDGAYVQSLPGGEVVSFRAWQSKKKPTDENDSKDEGFNDNPIDWAQDFESPIVATFDVLRRSPPSHSTDNSNAHPRQYPHQTPPHTHLHNHNTDNSPPQGQGHTFVLLQPQPSLHDFHPSLALQRHNRDARTGTGDSGHGYDTKNGNANIHRNGNDNGNANAHSNSGAESENNDSHQRDGHGGHVGKDDNSQQRNGHNGNDKESQQNTNSNTNPPNALLPNADAAYVGIVEETGSLFAMSPGRFPFVAFGGYDTNTKRKGGNKMKGGGGRGMRTIEAGKGKGKGKEDGYRDEDEDEPLGVDEITRRRKEREERERLEREREMAKAKSEQRDPDSESQSGNSRSGSSESGPDGANNNGSKPPSSSSPSPDLLAKQKQDQDQNVCPRPKEFECLVGMWKLEDNPESSIGLGSGYPAPVYPYIPGRSRYSGVGGFPGYPASYPGGARYPGHPVSGSVGGLPFPSGPDPGREYRYYGNDPVRLIEGPSSSSPEIDVPPISSSTREILDTTDRDGRSEHEQLGSEGQLYSWSEELALAAVLFCVLGLSVVWVWIGRLRSRRGGWNLNAGREEEQAQSKAAKAKAIADAVEGDGSELRKVAMENGNAKQDAEDVLANGNGVAIHVGEDDAETSQQRLQPSANSNSTLPESISNSGSSPSLSPKLTPRKRRQRSHASSSGSASAGAASTDVDGDVALDAVGLTDNEAVKIESEFEVDGDRDGDGDGEMDGDGDGPVDAEGGGEKKKRVRRGGRGKRKKKDKENQQQQQPATPAPLTPTPARVTPAPAPGMAGGIPGGRGVIVIPSPAAAMGSAVEQQSSLVVSDTVLGFGSHGTVVYAGSLQGRAVAVKRLLSSFVTLAAREVSILQESDDHPNVVRYYYQETAPGGEFMYIALELCLGTLAEVVEGSSAWTPGMALNLGLDNGVLQGGAGGFGSTSTISNGKADLLSIRESVMRDPKKALAQITRGLRHLHALKLVHRDIKPQNILVARAVGKPPPSKSKLNGAVGSGNGGGGGNYRMLISDFGLCKKLDMDQTSFLPTAQGAMAAGTVGWRAPEILRGEVRFDFEEVDLNADASRGSTSTVTGGSVGSTVSGASTGGKGKPTRLTKSVDIFALGCLFYYVLTGGGHPYGDRFEREVNILKGAKCLDGLERGWEGGFGSGGGGDGSDGAAEEGTEAAHLIRGMLEMESANRPDTDKILVHPFFWDAGKRLNFLQDASDRFEIMPRGEVPGSISKAASSSRISVSTSKSSNGPSPFEGERDPHLIRLENGAFDIVGMDWPSRCDKVFIDNLGKFRKYDGKSVQDLLRALRNKKHHYQDLPENVKRHLGSMPEGYLSYFTRRYPKLFIHVHQVVDTSELSKEDVFRSYFDLVE